MEKKNWFVIILWNGNQHEPTTVPYQEYNKAFSHYQKCKESPEIDEVFLAENKFKEAN